MYGHPYGTHPFPPPPPPVNSYGYQQQYHYPQHPAPSYPPQPPVYPVDPTTFRADYSKMLSELKFNSRQIIQDLSNVAQHNPRYADIVVSCIEQHIRRVSGYPLSTLTELSVRASLALSLCLPCIA